MSSSLYLDAIAEAKQLKEAAEANAKKAIIEAMTPQIRRLVENELIEGSNKDLTEGGDFLSEVFGLTESDVNNETFEIDENLLETITSSETEILEKDTTLKFAKVAKTFQESASLYNTMGVKDEETYQKFEIIASNLLDEAKTLRDDLIRIVEGEGSANAVTSLVDKLNTIIKETEKMSTRSEDEVLYELDLSELNLFEEDDEDEAVDLDVDAPEDAEGGDEDAEEGGDLDDLDDEGEDLGGESVELELDPDSAEALRAALIDALGADDEDADLGGEEGDDEEEVDEGAYEMEEGDASDDEWIEIDEGMLRREIAAMRKLREAPDLLKVKGIAKDMADQFGGKGSGKSGDDFGGGKRGKEPLSMSDKDLNVHAENVQLRKVAKSELRKNRNLNGKLTEAMAAVSELQGQLKEMNLFNAKLLYANKLLQNKNMSSRQMRSIVEALDNARSLREVKLLFKTMTESLSSKKSGDSLTESTVRRAVGSSSRPTRSASADNANPEVDRWATLAGLNK